MLGGRGAAIGHWRFRAPLQLEVPRFPALFRLIRDSSVLCRMSRGVKIVEPLFVIFGLLSNTNKVYSWFRTPGATEYLL